MSKKTKNEETMGKAYDAKLMKRLLIYAKPYWKLLLLSMLLLVLITGLELLNPYLLKVSIDDYINGYKKPMYEISINSPFDGIIFEGKKYIRQSSLSDSQQNSLNEVADKKIIKNNKNYYIVDISSEDTLQGNKLDRETYLQFRQDDISGINKISIIFFFVILFTFIFNYLQTIILNYTSQKIIYNIREDLFNHVQSLSISFFDKNPIGRLLTRVTNDTETLNEMYTSVLITLFKDLLMLVGIMFVMIKMDYKLALLSFSLVPLILLISMLFRNKIRVIYRKSRAQLASINSSLNENITGIRTIQIFNKEDKVSKSFDKLNNDYLITQKKEVKTYAIFRPTIEVIRSIGIATLVYFGGGKVVSGAIQFGVLYAFIDYLQKFFAPIIDLTEKYNILQSAMASSERIFNLLDNKDTIDNRSNIKTIDQVKGKIEFKNVWFAYNDKDWVLKDISFVINPGEAVAFVGPTGAGKSSIINLITRFYDIQKGEILLDGVNIKDIDKFLLRQNVGVVLQDVFIFTGTIENNIRLNNTDISDEDVVEVSKYVNAHHFISKLPNQYKEPVMERGSTLSSGERQLLAFARTLAHNPKILILDEATSNIDTETELLIQDALEKLIQGRTTIAVAHRLSTIQHADNIIVLSNGRIVETGNHQQLLEKEDMYYDLYKLQYNDEI